MEFITVRRLFYKLPGGCQVSLIEADDHSLYILKLNGSEGANLLFNEAYGAELLRHLRLPVATWAPLYLTNEFIDQHPEMWTQHGERKVRPTAGLHYGSRMVVSPRGSGSFQLIPTSWASKVKNPEDFLGVLAVDLWANHCDRRQVIYTPDRSGTQLRATFVDHGHMFGGPTGSWTTCARRAMLSDARFYAGLPATTIFKRWEKKIGRCVEDELRLLLKKVPYEWCNNNVIESTLSQLDTRRLQLGSLLGEAEWALKEYRSPVIASWRRSTEPRFEVETA